jgi:hypothetical protein
MQEKKSGKGINATTNPKVARVVLRLKILAI